MKIASKPQSPSQDTLGGKAFISQPTYCQTALDYARQGQLSKIDPKEIQGLSPEERYEIAKAAAAHCWDFPQRCDQFGIENADNRLELAQIAARIFPKPALFNLEKFDLADDEQLLAVAKTALGPGITQDSAHQVVNKIPFADEAKFYELAKHSAEFDGSSTSLHIRQFRGLDLDQRYEIAKIAAAQNGGGTSKSINFYEIKDQKKLFEIAKIAAAQDGGGTSKSINCYEIKDQEKLFEIAKIAAAQDGNATAFYIGKYDFTDQEKLSDIAHACLRESIAATTYLDRFTGLAVNEIKKKHWEHSTSSDDQVENFRAISKGLAALLARPTPPPGKALADWEGLKPYKRLDHIADYLQEQYGFAKDSIKLSPTIQAEEIISGVLAAQIVCSKQFGKDPMVSVAQLTGYKLSSGSDNTMRQTYGVLLEAYAAFGDDLSKTVPVDLEKHDPNALEIVELATAVKRLGGKLPEFTTKLDNSKAIGDAKKCLQEVLKEKFCVELELEASDSFRLEAVMGDLKPLIVLASRYKSTPAWREEIPILRQIATKILEGTFYDWRYRRDDKQLSMLTEEQLKRWRENPALVQKEYVVGEENAEEFNNKMIADIKDTYNKIKPISGVEKIERLNLEKVNQEIAKSDRDFAKSVNIKLVMNLLESVINPTSTPDPELVTRVIKLVNGCKRNFISPNSDSKLGKYFSDLSKAVNKKRNKGQSYTVISVITDDPILLLKTGDLVQSASCQNYRSGNQIQSLPSYAIDGNIKLALSYVVKTEFLKRKFNGEDFYFEPSAQTLTSGEKEPINLGYAMRRQLLRVGSSGSDAINVTERAYAQSHPIENEIKAQQAALIKAFCEECGILNGNSGTVVFPESRNPNGTYTDVGGGQKIGEYSVQSA